VKGKDLPKIHLLLAGSPCTGFSVSGKKQYFDDPNSALISEVVRLLRETKPQYFLLENVVLPQQYRDKISKMMGVQPIKINSSLVSAQNRRRLYWTNIPGVTQPKDKHQRLGHVVENVPPSVSIRPVTRKNLTNIRAKLKKIVGNSVYANTFRWRWDSTGRILVMYPNKLKMQRIGRISFMDNKIEIITKSTRPYLCTRGYEIRRVTPEECELLQTLPRGYTQSLASVTGRYSCIGNGWTVDVITHILSHIPRKRK